MLGEVSMHDEASVWTANAYGENHAHGIAGRIW